MQKHGCRCENTPIFLQPIQVVLIDLAENTRSSTRDFVVKRRARDVQRVVRLAERAGRVGIQPSAALQVVSSVVYRMLIAEGDGTYSGVVCEPKLPQRARKF